MLYALAFARAMAGSKRLANMPMMPMTTSNSISVKARRERVGSAIAGELKNPAEPLALSSPAPRPSTIGSR
jgi:hypothetical protein